jgi:Sigma-70 region 2
MAQGRGVVVRWTGALSVAVVKQQHGGPRTRLLVAGGRRRTRSSSSWNWPTPPVHDEVPDAATCWTDDRFERYRRTRDRNLRKALVLECGWLARRCAFRFTHPGEPWEDLVEVAQLGVVKAVERYDPSFGVPFSAFAMPAVLRDFDATSVTRGGSSPLVSVETTAS